MKNDIHYGDRDQGVQVCLPRNATNYLPSPGVKKDTDKKLLLEPQKESKLPTT